MGTVTNRTSVTSQGGLVISQGSYTSPDHMGGASVRNGFTSRGTHGLDGWNDTKLIYAVFQINLGNNPTQNLEVVSSLNLFNISHYMYYFRYTCIAKYNPKLYLGSAVQSASERWNYDAQKDQTNGLPDLVPSVQKSGS